jgi:hypothetical protein
VFRNFAASVAFDQPGDFLGSQLLGVSFFVDEVDGSHSRHLGYHLMWAKVKVL